MSEHHKDLAHLRTDYKQARARRARRRPRSARANSRSWFDAAVAAKVPEPNAMTLATVDAGGKPAARIVLLKEVDARGFTFYTNYESRKGRELAAHPCAALLFFWPELERQVRIEGAIEKVDPATADAYFRVRPQALAHRRVGVAAKRAAARPGGARGALRGSASTAFPARRWRGRRTGAATACCPTSFEFWQGRASRLHDRVVYTRDGDGWRIGRLAP